MERFLGMIIAVRKKKNSRRLAPGSCHFHPLMAPSDTSQITIYNGAKTVSFTTSNVQVTKHISSLKRPQS